MKLLMDKTNANTLWKHLHCPIIWLSLDYKILDINKAALKIYQWQKKIAQDQDYIALCKYYDFPCPIYRNKTKLLSGKTINNIETVIDVNGQEKTVLWSIEYSYDENKQPNGFMLVGEDVTKRKQEEDKVFQLNSIINQMPHSVYWYDENCTYLGVNNFCVKEFRTPRKNIIGKNFKHFAKKLGWSQEFLDDLQQEAHQITATKQPSHDKEELPFILANGKAIYQVSNKVPLLNKKGEAIGVLGISIDITEKKQMERKLEQARKLQEKSQNAKIQGMMEIAAGIAHEIRTPLTSIQCATDAKVYMDRLIAGYKMAEVAGLSVTSIRPSHMEGLKNIFNSIDAEAKESMSIIDMFLSNLKNMVKEANTGDYQLCSIKKSIGTALSRYPFDAKQKNSVTYTDVDDFKFYGVNLLIQHIIFNLMKNALYYINEKPGSRINIRHEQGDTDNYLYFKDTGPGISEYDQEHVFDFGFSKRKDGSGFGLTYCKTTIQQMGGDIAVCSELGKYTEFVLTFPKVME